jgi:Anti-sigma factor NepR
VTGSDITASNVTRKNRPLQESPRTMNLAVKCSFVESVSPPHSVDNQIRAFLAGDSHGEDLLHAIYDHVLDEPVPERLRTLLKS